MIKKVKLINFRGYENAEFEFAPLSVVVGCNAHGKTTLLDALALVGAASDIAARRASTDGSDRVVVVGAPLADIAVRMGGWGD
ncbi:MAG: ATP-binding protein [Enhygromyxa sp.]